MKTQKKETLDYIGTDDCQFWDLESMFENKLDREILDEILGTEQAVVIGKILKSIKNALFIFHDTKDEESHQDIRIKLDKTDARLRNHRHETGTSWSGKAEY